MQVTYFPLILHILVGEQMFSQTRHRTCLCVAGCLSLTVTDSSRFLNVLVAITPQLFFVHLFQRTLLSARGILSQCYWSFGLPSYLSSTIPVVFYLPDTPWEVFLSPCIMLFFWFIPLKSELWINYQLLKRLPEFFNKKATLSLARPHLLPFLHTHSLLQASPTQELAIRKQTHFPQTITFLFCLLCLSFDLIFPEKICLLVCFHYLFPKIKSLLFLRQSFSGQGWHHLQESHIRSQLSVYKTLFWSLWSNRTTSQEARLPLTGSLFWEAEFTVVGRVDCRTGPSQRWWMRWIHEGMGDYWNQLTGIACLHCVRSTLSLEASLP